MNVNLILDFFRVKVYYPPAKRRLIFLRRNAKIKKAGIAMKRTNGYFCCVAAVMAFAIIMAWVGTAMAAGNYVILSDTASPDGKYSLAWGYSSGAGIDYEKLNKGDEAYFGTIPEGNTVENYIVDTAAAKIVCKIPDCDFYALGAIIKGNTYITATWSADSKNLIYAIMCKTCTLSLDYFASNADGFGRHDLMVPLMNEAKNYLKKKYASKYKKYEEELVFSYFDEKITNDKALDISISVEVPGQEVFSCTLKLAAKLDTTNKAELKLTAVNIKEEK